ncbi:MAG: M20 family metallopeptidase [Promethearchaeota archaeon]
MDLKEDFKQEIVSILKKLVQIPSENPPGITKDIVKYLISNVFKEKEGFRNQVVTNKKNGVELHNLISTIGNGKEVIALSGHFDVVPIGDASQWRDPPFSAEIKGGRLYGRGSADMKGGIAFLIGVIKILSEIPEFLEKYTLMFLGTADEEDGMTGSITLSRQDIINDLILLVIAEPTNLKIGIGEKGLLWVKLRITGKAAHGSMPQEGINAIKRALEILPQLHDFLGERNNDILGNSTLNIGKINGGTAINVVPDQVVLDLDYRLIPEQDQTLLIKDLNSLQKSGLPINVEVLKELPALVTDPNHLFIQNIKEISKNEIVGLPYATDAAHFINSKNPIPFVIYGPGDPINIHKTDEYIEIDHIFKAIEHLTSALLRTYLK